MQPIGLKPLETAKLIRIEEVKDAIIRYVEAGYMVPMEWLEEYNSAVLEAGQGKLKFE